MDCSRVGNADDTFLHKHDDLEGKAMAGRIVSIEIGNYTTRVIEMDYKGKKTPKIHHFFSIPTPDYMVADGSVIIDHEFIAAMKRAFAANNIRTNKAIFVLNSARIASREVTVPAVKETKIHELLVTNSAEYFPVDLVQYQLVHHIVERNTQENTYKLSVLAVPNEMIQSYLALAEALGLQVEALDYIGNSVTQGMLKFLPDEMKVSVKVDEQSALITIIRGEKVELQRNISYGIRDAVEVVADHPAFGAKKTFAQALELMKEHNCLGEEEVEENLRPLFGNVRRILDYYTSRNLDVTLGEVWLLGVGAECEGLGELLAAELNVKISPLNSLPREYEFAKNLVSTEFSVPEYAACIAATIAPLNFTLNNEEKKGAFGKLLAKSELGYAPLICGICLLIAVGMIIYSLASTSVLKMKNAEMEYQISQLHAAQQAYDTYTKTQAQHNDLAQMYALTETPDDALLAFLAEMEEKMPSEISVYSMTAGTDGVNMNITVTSKAAAAKVLMQLRSFETIDEVDTPGVSEAGDGGKATVSFSVYCTYAGE